MLLISCNPKENLTEKWKKEIMDAEVAFSKLVQEEGMQKGFLTYAADDVVVKRGEELIIGIDSLKKSYTDEKKSETINLSWKPDFVAVSSSGDLGYTYGKYRYITTDSVGDTTTQTGIFHTVWKRQEDGEWRFVWD